MNQGTTTGKQRLGLPTLGELCIGVALACNISWVSMSFKSMGIFAGYAHGENLLDAAYLISIISVAATLAVIGIFYRQAGKLIDKTPIKLGMPFGVSVSTLLMPLSGLDGMVGVFFLAMTGFFSGVFSGVLLLYFGMALSMLKARSAVLVAAIGSMFSTLLFALFLLFSPFEASIFAASMPLIAILLLHFGLQNTKRPDPAAFVPIAAQKPLSDAQESHELARLTRGLAFCSVLVGFANEAVRTIYIQMGIAGGGGQAYAVLEAFVAFTVSCCAVLITLAMLNNKSYLMPRYCYRAIVVFLFIGVMLSPLPLIYPQVAVFIPYAINAASYLCFSMMMWIVVAGVCGRYSSMRLRTFAFIRCFWAIGPLLGLLLGRFVIHQLGLSIQSVFPIMALAALALLLVISVAFTETDLMNAMNVIPTERRRRFVERCETVVDRYGLSEREGEIMTMFAKGRNLAYIQVHLSLSKSTVSTHRQHIYQKLGIHSHQELLDLVQDMELSDRPHPYAIETISERKAL